MIQTISVSKDGSSWETLGEALTEYNALNGNTEMTDIIGQFKSYDAVITDITLSEDGTTITFTRDWIDSSYDTFINDYATEITNHREFVRGNGWNVVASDEA